MRKSRPLTPLEADALKHRLKNLVNQFKANKGFRDWNTVSYIASNNQLEQLVVDASLITAEFLIEIRQQMGELE